MTNKPPTQQPNNPLEVSLEWNANDEGPPCIDFTCPCGHRRHLCNGPDWITDGPGQVPGVECVKCGRAWSLYRVQTTVMIRTAGERAHGQPNHNRATCTRCQLRKLMWGEEL